mgnify:CR=1 FL=1
MLDAIERILEREGCQAFVPIAGLHHARRNRAAGFCVFNDCGVVIEYLRRRYGVQRVAYVDIDAHHPDGVEHGFADDLDLLLISVHEERRWPFTGDLFTADEVEAMAADAHSTNFAENKAFFLNANDPANFERTWKNITFVYRELGLIDSPVRFDEVMDFSVLKQLDREGGFAHQKDEYRSTFVPSSFARVSAEAPILTQTIRINFYPNSANIFEPQHGEDGQPLKNTLYDPSVSATLEKAARERVITVKSDPSGAKVFVDGDPYGYSNIYRTLKVGSGNAAEDDLRWAWLDLDLFESVKGMTVKKTAIRYPLRVVRHAVDLEANPWGLALDGFAGEGPRRLTEDELAPDSKTKKTANGD